MSYRVVERRYHEIIACTAPFPVANFYYPYIVTSFPLTLKSLPPLPA